MGLTCNRRCCRRRCKAAGCRRPLCWGSHPCGHAAYTRATPHAQPPWVFYKCGNLIAVPVVRAAPSGALNIAAANAAWGAVQRRTNVVKSARQVSTVLCCMKTYEVYTCGPLALVQPKKHIRCFDCARCICSCRHRACIPSVRTKLTTLRSTTCQIGSTKLSCTTASEFLQQFRNLLCIPRLIMPAPISVSGVSGSF